MLYARLWLAWVWFSVERKVRRHGWTALYVGDYRTAPTWGYTIGFDGTLDQPEVIVFDATRAVANRLFHRVFRELREQTLVLEDGNVWPEDDPRAGVWRKVHPSQIDCRENWLAFAVERRRRLTGRAFGLEAFQYVLPDRDGRLPWQEGYDETLRPFQPALYAPEGIKGSPLAATNAV